MITAKFPYSCVLNNTLADTWNRALSVEAFAMDMWLGVVIIPLSGCAHGRLTVMMIDKLVCEAPGMRVGTSTAVCRAVLVVARIALECVKPVSCAIDARNNCSKVCRCWPITAVSGCPASQAWMPSYHVCGSFVLPVAPHFPNQEPPRAQQLSLPDLLMVPHLRHKESMIVVVAADVCMWEIIVNGKGNTLQNHHKSSIDIQYAWTYTCRLPRPQTNCGEIFCSQHLRNSHTNCPQERNNWLVWISRRCRSVHMSWRPTEILMCCVTWRLVCLLFAIALAIAEVMTQKSHTLPMNVPASTILTQTSHRTC